MQQKHAEEIAALRAELGRHDQSAQHSASTVHRNQHRENENQDRQASQRTNPNGNQHTNPSGNQQGNPDGSEREQPVPLQTVRPTSLLPFTMTIMQTPMPEKSPLMLEKYDGSADPDNHLRIFTNTMAFYMDNDPVICRAFSLSLKDEALEWYNTLPPNSVDCFATAICLHSETGDSTSGLENTKQEKGETLKTFMKSGELPRTFKSDHFTALDAPRAKVLEEALNVELLTLRRKPSPKNADERKRHLRKYIKEGRGSLPKERYLQRSPERTYRKDKQRRSYSRSPSRHRERSVRGVIN
ncbi:hypothetical protein V8G54_007251 [Vigna mungo]|uniref:Retrotransposon gag domain-containing protein n=1 Tax=Vigna mungo TaxID=3915 RepID=A0AAQ3S5A3_VIGMU